jgi:hypothetical protein
MSFQLPIRFHYTDLGLQSQYQDFVLDMSTDGHIVPHDIDPHDPNTMPVSGSEYNAGEVVVVGKATSPDMKSAFGMFLVGYNTAWP